MVPYFHLRLFYYNTDIVFPPLTFRPRRLSQDVISRYKELQKRGHSVKNQVGKILGCLGTLNIMGSQAGSKYFSYVSRALLICLVISLMIIIVLILVLQNGCD